MAKRFAVREAMHFYAVTDSGQNQRLSLTEQIAAACRGGITCLQLREKTLSGEALLERAQEVKAVCRYYGVPFLVNDAVEIACMADADGVHIGQEDGDIREVRKKLGADRILGVSVHTAAQARYAWQAGADYLGVGAVFATGTKKDAVVLPEGRVECICRETPLPVVAIGGITKERIPELAGSGVDGVALVSAIFGAEDIEAACRRLRECIWQSLVGVSR